MPEDPRKNEELNDNPTTSSRRVNESDNHTSTKKVVDTAAKGAAEYFAPGVGAKAYDTAKKVPVLGDQIDEATTKAAEVADKVPGMQKLTKKLDDSGAVDAANAGISMIGGSAGKTPGAKPTTPESPSSKPSLNPGQFRKNGSFMNRSQEIGDVPSEPENDLREADDQSTDSPKTSDTLKNPLETSFSGKDNTVEGEGIDKEKLIKLWKYRWLILGAGGFFFFFIILFIIFGGESMNLSNQMGYYNSACNFNETRVSITNCDGREDIMFDSLDSAVKKLTYLYIKDNNYADEAKKALMIILKTNILSYGNYTSGASRVDVSMCSLYSSYDDSLKETLFDDYEKYESSLNALYEEVSKYLYISSTYTGTINALNPSNALELSENKLNILKNFEEYSYEEILEKTYQSNASESSENGNNTLFIGDSRTAGMAMYGYLSDKNSVYASGEGYKWFINDEVPTNTTNALNGGISKANELLSQNNFKNIVIWLGINDLDNVSNYFEKYEELATSSWSNYKIYIVSIGPVDDDKATVNNSMINDFNNEMKRLIEQESLSNLKWLNLNLKATDINSYDDAGLHYSKTDSKKIYDIISQNVGSVSSKLSLYNLSENCTYYTLTENDAYWWPIGSATATDGDIYGGEPVSTQINSYFAGRFHPVTHVWQPAHGALDIAASMNTIIIATKDGTVNRTVTGCTAGDHQCGGTYGNYIKIDHGDGIESLYAHLTTLLVHDGEHVKQGQIIAYSGNTGRVTGPHLHFEIRLNGVKVDPLNYVDPENPRPIKISSSIIDGEIEVVGDTGDYSDRAKNKSIVCKSLLASGFSENATIGIMTNMQSESASTFSPEIVEYGSGYNFSNIYTAPPTVAAGFGLIQWSFGRRINLINYARENNANPASMSAQLNYFYKEVSENHSYDITRKYITGSFSAYDTAVAFCKNFERPRGSKTDLKAQDSCTARADNNVSSITKYVLNGCE